MKVLLVYDSIFGHIGEAADEAEEVAGRMGHLVRSGVVRYVDPEEVRAYDLVLLATPTLKGKTTVAMRRFCRTVPVVPEQPALAVFGSITRVDRSAGYAGGPAEVESLLRRRGWRSVAPPLTFGVGDAYGAQASARLSTEQMAQLRAFVRQVLTTAHRIRAA